jgi:5-methylcytosine-specific restriction endonuclease McrA
MRALDHVIPHKGNAKLFSAGDNLQGLCQQHDDRKRARESGIAPCAHELHCNVMGRKVCAMCGARALAA